MSSRRVVRSHLMIASMLLTTALAESADAQSEPAPRALGTPAAVITGEFSAIHSVHELPDGRLLIADASDPVVHVYVPASRTLSVLGTRGAGPGEYRQPGGFYAAAGDTVLLLDRGQPRVLVIDPQGRIVDTRRFELAGGVQHVSSGVGDDRHLLDRLGRIYGDAFAFPGGGGIMAQFQSQTDSMPLIRYAPASARTDTLTWLRRAEVTVIRNGSSMAASTTRFSPADAWSVTADGWVAVARAVPYRIDWIDPSGRIHIGLVTPHTVLRVTAADRDGGRGQRGQNTQASVSGGGTPASPEVTSPEPKFADVKPPFASTRGIRVSSDRRAWVRRQQPAGSEATVYDVFDGAGRRTDRVALPDRSHIVGFSARSLFVAELDGDDVPRLLVYPLP